MTGVQGAAPLGLRFLQRLRRPNVVVDRAYAAWLRRLPVSVGPDHGALISVVMPVFDTPADVLLAAIASMRAQTYTDWELCIADDASPAPHVAAMLHAQCEAEPRIRFVRLAINEGIAGATNAALGLARGDYVALLDHDDLLAPHALARVAAEIAAHPDAELIFSDEDKLEDGRRARPYFKPGWNPDLMLSQNMVSHLGVYRRTRVLALGGLRPDLEGSQDYDLALRVAFSCGASQVRHIPEVLYHWRQTGRSFSATQAARASEAGRRAVAERLPNGTIVQPDPVLPHWNRVIHLLKPTHISVVTQPGSPPLPDNHADIEIVGDPAHAQGDVLVFLAPNMQAHGAGWLRELASQVQRPGVGAAGARLDRPDGRIWQSGLVLDPWCIAQTLRPRSDADDPGYVGHFRLARTVSALSRACLAMRRDLFVELGGFDPACGPYADIDLCLRLAAVGLRCVWTPAARLRHMTLPPTPRDRPAARLMRARWGDALARDPYLNPNLSIRHGRLVLRHRPASPPRNIP